MKLIYLAGPYRGKSKFKPLNWLQRQINIHNARQASKKLWQVGHAVLCPHTNTSNFDGLCPDQIFLDGTLEMMRRCDAIVLLPNWSKSSGTRAELEEAGNLKIRVYFLEDILEGKEL